MCNSESTSNKGKGRFDIFQNFAYVSSYLYLKGISWKRDCKISSKVKML